MGLGKDILLAAMVLLSILLVFTLPSNLTAKAVGKWESENKTHACPVYTITRTPEQDEFEMCADTLNLYVNKVDELKTRVKTLENKIMIFLKNKCNVPGNFKSFSEIEHADTGSIRDFTLFIISNSKDDPASAIYSYIRKHIRYVSDPINKDYIASPCETILTEAGDCEDHALLLFSMLNSVGIDSKIVRISDEHTFVAIDSDTPINNMCENPIYIKINKKKYILADTTSSNCIGLVNKKYVQEGKNGEMMLKKEYSNRIRIF